MHVLRQALGFALPFPAAAHGRPKPRLTFPSFEYAGATSSRVLERIE